MASSTEDHVELDQVAPANPSDLADGTPGPEPVELTYLERIEREVGKETYEEDWGRFLRGQDFSLNLVAQDRQFELYGHSATVADDVDQMCSFMAENERYVMVVNNIDIPWINLLGRHFRLDPVFFADHFRDTGMFDGIPTSPKQRGDLLDNHDDSRTRGLVVDLRYFFKPGASRLQASISYYRLPPHGCKSSHSVPLVAAC